MMSEPQFEVEPMFDVSEYEVIEGEEPRPYDVALDALTDAAATVKDRIAELVRARLAVNEEIKLLRAEDERLTRMLKVASQKITVPDE